MLPRSPDSGASALPPAEADQPPPRPLHSICQLTQLRSLDLYCPDDEVEEEGASSFQHLPQLQLLSRLRYFSNAGIDCCVARAFAAAVGDLPSLRELELPHWPSADPVDQPSWQALMQSLEKLTQLSLLKFEQWLLRHSSSAAYLPVLASTLRTLPSLSHLELTGGFNSPADGGDESIFGVGSALVAAIGSLNLQTLVLCKLAVSVQACCRHLAPLTRLNHLELVSLRAPEPVAHEAAGDAADSTFVHLLSGLTQLQTLKLKTVGFKGRAAMLVFSIVVPTLLDLQLLDVSGNGLAASPLTVLAQRCVQLPSLHVICGSNALAAAGVPQPDVLADLNWVAGRDVFSVLGP